MNRADFIVSFNGKKNHDKIRFLSLMVFYITIQARDSYGSTESDGFAELRRLNEIQHTLSGYLCKLTAGEDPWSVETFWDAMSSRMAGLRDTGIEKATEWANKFAVNSN